MSLLDTFVMIFQADTTEATRRIDDLTNSNEDLEDAARGSTEALEGQGKSLARLAGTLVGFAAASFSAGAILAGAFQRADNIRAIEQTADAIGSAIEDVDAFGRAAEAMGGDAQGARDSLTDMAEKMGEAFSDVESGSAQAFAALGISLKNVDGSTKDAISGMLDLASSVEGMSKTEAVFKIKSLGITDNRTVEMVLKGRQELERLLKVQKEQGTVTKESAENARKLTEAMGSLKNGMASAGAGFLDAIIPSLTKVIEWLSKGVDWMNKHKSFVLGFFGAIAAVVAAVYLPAMASAAVATLAATWPLLAIGAAVAVAAAAFALIYDDIMNFVDGNDSFIGQISEKYPIVGAIVMGLIDAFKVMFDTLITGANQIGAFVAAGFSQVVDGISYAIDFMVEAYGKIMGFTDSVVAAFSAMGEAVAAIFTAMVDAIRGALSFASAGIDKIKSGVSGVASFFGLGDDSESVGAAMSSAGQQLASASGAPSNGVSSSAVSNSVSRSSNEVTVGQVVVNSQATDAQGVARDVGSELQGQLKDLEHQSATGVAR